MTVYSTGIKDLLRICDASGGCNFSCGVYRV